MFWAMPGIKDQHGQGGQGSFLRGGGAPATFKDRRIRIIRWEQGRCPKGITGESTKYYSTYEWKDLYRSRLLWRQVPEMQFKLALAKRVIYWSMWLLSGMAGSRCLNHTFRVKYWLYSQAGSLLRGGCHLQVHMLAASNLSREWDAFYNSLNRSPRMDSHWLSLGHSGTIHCSLGDLELWLTRSLGIIVPHHLINRWWHRPV